MIQIVEGYTNNEREFRVYINMVNVIQFPTYEEALKYKQALELELASIKDDEQKED